VYSQSVRDLPCKDVRVQAFRGHRLDAPDKPVRIDVDLQRKDEHVPDDCRADFLIRPQTARKVVCQVRGEALHTLEAP
jgi:hypothetical protein